MGGLGAGGRSEAGGGRSESKGRSRFRGDEDAGRRNPMDGWEVESGGVFFDSVLLDACALGLVIREMLVYQELLHCNQKDGHCCCKEPTFFSSLLFWRGSQ